MGKSKIEWTEATWNPVTGCTEISPGCKNCYAKGMARRLKAMGQHKYRNEFKVTTHPECLDEPLKWKKPRRIFVCSMSDLFHEDVPFKFIDKIFGRMALTEQHTYIILTKRPERMLHYVEKYWGQNMANAFPNVWFGVTCENQEQADKRIPILLQIPAAVRFVSVEPMLGAIELMTDYLSLKCGGRYPFKLDDEYRTKILHRLDWVICGCESGKGRRETKIEWVRKLRDDCKAAGVPFFLKQLAVNGKLEKMPELDGDTYDMMPNEFKRIE